MRCRLGFEGCSVPPVSCDTCSQTFFSLRGRGGDIGEGRWARKVKALAAETFPFGLGRVPGWPRRENAQEAPGDAVVVLQEKS